MSIRPFRDIKRKKTKKIKVGKVDVGGDAPNICSIYDKYFNNRYKRCNS